MFTDFWEVYLLAVNPIQRTIPCFTYLLGGLGDPLQRTIFCFTYFLGGLGEAFGGTQGDLFPAAMKSSKATATSHRPSLRHPLMAPSVVWV